LPHHDELSSNSKILTNVGFLRLDLVSATVSSNSFDVLAIKGKIRYGKSLASLLQAISIIMTPSGETTTPPLRACWH
jgi:hypothetical protein